MSTESEDTRSQDGQDAGEGARTGGIARKVSRRKEHEGELGKFGGLDRDGSQPQPAGGAVARLAETGDKHRGEQNERRDERGNAELRAARKVDAGDEDEGGKPQDKPQELLFEEVKLVPVLQLCRIAARGIHEEDAERRDRSDASRKEEIPLPCLPDAQRIQTPRAGSAPPLSQAARHRMQLPFPRRFRRNTAGRGRQSVPRAPQSCGRHRSLPKRERGARSAPAAP